MPRKPDTQLCRLCQRKAPLTFHHLIPRKVHRRPRFRKHYSVEALQSGIWVCCPCHRAIHKFHREMELAVHFYSLDRLLLDPLLQNHIHWAQKQKIRAD